MKIGTNKTLEINESFEIYSGDLILTSKNYQQKVNGVLFFCWIPRVEVRIKGKGDPGLDAIRFMGENTFIILPSQQKFQVRLGIKVTESVFEFEGRVIPPVFMTDKKTSIDNLTFQLPNLREFNTIKGGLELRCDEFIIKIEKEENFDEKYKELKQQGGYQLLYKGSISKVNNDRFIEADLELIHESLKLYLQFLNGRRCSAILRKGYLKGKHVFDDYSPYINDDFKNVLSWPSKYPIDYLDDLWESFYRKCKDENDKDCLNIILHWYTESNSNSGFVEGSIALIQNALELLFHWIISEDLGLVSERNADKLSAASKIGFMLAHCNIDPTVPDTLKNLQEIGIKMNLVNGPEVFTYIRNSIVHPNKKKRQSLKKLGPHVKHETWCLGLWYVELILLHHLGYYGEYVNRCNYESRSAGVSELVPWAKNPKQTTN